MHSTKQLTPATPDEQAETWLREDVAPAYDALKADASRAISARDVRAALITRRKTRE
jgi:antitoxin ParD1/3/4